MKTSEALARLRGGKGQRPEKISAVAVLINKEHASVIGSLRDGLAHAIRAGDLLAKAKAMLKHGDFATWIEKHCDFSYRTAASYMRVAAKYPELSNVQRVAHLSFRDALKLLTQPDDNVHFSSASDQWYTPAEIIALATSALGAIELDPCADDEKSVPASVHFTAKDDGLSQAWSGRVYMNPPYGSEIGAWVKKLCEEYAIGSVTEAIALVPARPDTEWWRMFRDFAVCFVDGRLKFSGHDNSAPFPSALIYLGSNIDRFAWACSGVGSTWTRIRV